MWNINTATLFCYVLSFMIFCEPSRADIAVGYGVDIFRYWGDLGHFLKADIKNVMLPVFQHPVVNSKKLEADGRLLLKGGFQVELCRDVSELLQTMFRSYFVERSKRPWRLFSAGWTKNKMARKLGLNSTYLNGHHGFAFLRMSRYRQAMTLDQVTRNDEIVTPIVEHNVRTVQPGRVPSALDFFATSGSHYVSSFVTGEAVFQVFVYSVPTFIAIQQRMKTIKLQDSENQALDDYVKFFSPWYAEHVGNIMVASENPDLETWANNNFLLHMSIFSYPSLIKLYLDPTLMHHMDKLMGNDALLNIDLRTLEFAFTDYNRRFWFQQVLDNYLKLWEENG